MTNNLLLVRLGLASQPPHMDTIYMNQPAVLFSHVNEPATIQTDTNGASKPDWI